ncbi:MAG TPA: DegV family protein [Actinomycetes bacterium]|nr:DegV family protein [Actinomycetes bacterium]
MSGNVVVVTDSTAYLPAAQARAAGVTIVPVQVVLGGESRDETDVSSADVAVALREWTPVSTSRPSPSAFASVYRQAAESGASGIVSVHLSGSMSATVESAQLAAKEATIPVRVIDSHSIGMGMGFAVLTAAQAANTGADLLTVEQIVRDRCARSSVLFYVDTLEYLRRGGRIGKAAALLGSALSVKPLLHLVDGHVEPLEKVRTASKALARLEEITIERIGEGAADVAVQHLSNPERAQALVTRLQEHLGGAVAVTVGEVGAVVGAHVGPGMIAVSIAPR